MTYFPNNYNRNEKLPDQDTPGSGKESRYHRTYTESKVDQYSQRHYSSPTDSRSGNRLNSRAVEQKSRTLTDPRVLRYNQDIKYYADHGNIEESERILRDLKYSRLKPDAYSYNPILKFYVHNKEERNVNSTIEEMRRLGIPFDTTTYNLLISFRINQGDYIGALKIQGDMQMAGIQPDRYTDFFMKTVNQSLDTTSSTSQSNKSKDDILKEYNEKIRAAASANDYFTCGKLILAISQLGLRPNVYSYNPIMFMHCRNKNEKKALVTLEQMREEQIKPDERTFNSLINLFVNLGKKEEVFKIIDEMSEANIPLSRFTYSSLIKMYVNEGNKEKTWETWKDFKAKCFEPEEEHSIDRTIMKLYENEPIIEFYHDKIKQEASLGNIEACKKIIYDMVDAKVLPNEYTYYPILELFVEANDEKSVNATLDEMRRFGIQMNSSVYTFLFNLCYSKENYKQAKDTYRVMSLAGIEPDRDIFLKMNHIIEISKDITDFRVISFNKRILEESRKNNIDACKTILKEISVAELTPDSYSYNPILNFYVKKEDENGVKEILYEMTQNKVRYDAVTYNILINLYVKLGKDEKVIELFNTMHKDGLTPDETTFNSIIKLYVKRGNEEEVLKTFSEMQSANLKPNKYTFTNLISLYSKNKDERNVIKTFEEMKKANIKPDLITYNVLINLYAELGYERKALEFYSMMKDEGFTPEQSTYTILIKLYINKNNFSEAFKFYNLMIDKVRIDAIPLFNSMMVYFVNSKDENKMIKILDDIRKAGLLPNVSTYNTIMDFYIKTGNFHKATQFFEQMKREHIIPDTTTYNLLISLYAKLGNIEKVFGTFDQMKNDNVKPDTVTYNLLIDFFSKKRKTDTAFLLYEEMKQLGIKSDDITVDTLVESYVRAKKIDEAKKMFLTRSNFTHLKNNEKIDLHGLSHGAAYIAFVIFLEEYKPKSFELITGIGLHSKKEIAFEMKHYMLEKIKKYHPDLMYFEPEKNPGVLIIKRRTES